MRTASRRNSSVYLVPNLNLLHSKHCSKKTGAKPRQDQAARDPIYSGHVDIPLPPMQLAGTLTIADFRAKRAELLANITETATSKNGTTYTRGLHKYAATLYTEIHSHPMTSEEFIADPDSMEAVHREWAARVVADFKTRMPKGIDYTVVLHLDEGHVHIHILAMYSDDTKLDANKLHAGKVAAALHCDQNVSAAIETPPKPELAQRPNKPRKSHPSKNRVTQKKNDASHDAAVIGWETECAEIDATKDGPITAWEA